MIDLQFTALGFKICWIITLGFVSSETTAIWKWLQQYLTVCMYVCIGAPVVVEPGQEVGGVPVGAEGFPVSVRPDHVRSVHVHDLV